MATATKEQTEYLFRTDVRKLVLALRVNNQVKTVRSDNNLLRVTDQATAEQIRKHKRFGLDIHELTDSDPSGRFLAYGNRLTVLNRMDRAEIWSLLPPDKIRELQFNSSTPKEALLAAVLELGITP